MLVLGRARFDELSSGGEATQAHVTENSMAAGRDKAKGIASPPLSLPSQRCVSLSKSHRHHIRLDVGRDPGRGLRPRRLLLNRFRHAAQTPSREFP